MAALRATHSRKRGRASLQVCAAAPGAQMRTQGVCEAGGSLCLRTAAPRPAQLPPLQRRTARAGPRGRAAKSARPGSRCESGESAVHVREREPERQAGPPYEARVPRGGPAPRQTVMSVKSPQLSALEPLWLEAAAESESLRPRSSRARHTRCAQPSAQPAAPTVRVAARRCFPGCCQRNSLGDCAPRRATLSPANAHGLFVGSPWGLHCMRIANRAYSISGVIRRVLSAGSLSGFGCSWFLSSSCGPSLASRHS